VTGHEGGPTLKEFRKVFNIFDAIKVFSEAWKEVRESSVARICAQNSLVFRKI
jgi:hypothetical protein